MSIRSAVSSKKSELEKLHAEADSLLTQKSQEITQLNEQIDEAEQNLLSIKAELARQIKENTSQNIEEEVQIDTGIFQQEIADLNSLHEEEIQRLQEEHDKKMKEMTEQFDKAIESAKAWAVSHSDQIAADKQAQLEEMQRSLESLKSSTTENISTMSKNKYASLQESKRASFLNQQRIKLLESQISELTAITREETRDIKLKIDECLTAIELRSREHQSEIEKYEKEMSEREAKYKEHIANVLDQYAVENKRMESSIAATTSQVEYLPRLLKQIEKQGDAHYQTSIKDLEKVKSTLSRTQTQDERDQMEVKKTIIQYQSIQRDQRKIEQEIVEIDAEINQLNRENETLRSELNRLNQTVYSSK